MKSLIAITSFIIAFCIYGCNKDGGNTNSQTLFLLQNKWTLISSNLEFADMYSLNSTYTGISSDYYWFNTNDSLNIHQAGNVNMPQVPLSLTTYYSLINDSVLFYGNNTGTEVNIKALTNNLLVLFNKATASFINADGTINYYNGVKVDSLRR